MLAAGLFVGVGFLTLSELTDLSRGPQIVRQLGGIGVTWAWGFGMTLMILFALKFTLGLRVEEGQEEEGLDLSQHGEQGYGT